MFKKLLVPVDGSATSQLAVDKAVGLARAFGSEMTVLFVIDPYPFTGVGEGFAYGQNHYLGVMQAEAALAGARKAMEAAGVQGTALQIESHVVWRGILEAAAGAGADLIVMGSHGRSGIEKLVLGSVAQRVVAQATIAVLVVRG